MPEQTPGHAVLPCPAAPPAGSGQERDREKAGDGDADMGEEPEVADLDDAFLDFRGHVGQRKK